MRRVTASLMAGALAGALAGAAPGAGQTAEPRSWPVVVVSIDGLRPDAIARFGLATLESLMTEGAYALDATTILPSRTLPSHTSMLTGVGPETHRITWNRRVRGLGVVGVPTVFELARARGLGTAAFYAKAKFRHLDRPGAYDYREAPSSNLDNWMATDVVPAAVRYIRHLRPDLVFVHVSEPDYAGHALGWMSPVYGLAVRRADAAVARIVESATRAYGPGAYTLIVTSDHGGTGRGHGGDDPAEMLIPWIAWGRGVERGARPAGVRTVDTAATILWLLGVPLPTGMEGRPVTTAFSAGAIPGR